MTFEDPEGVSVLVVTPSETVARVAAAPLARRLYPGAEFGDIPLHVEWVPQEGGFEVVLPRISTEAVPSVPRGYRLNSEAWLAGFTRTPGRDDSRFWRWIGPDRFAYQAGCVARQAAR